MSSHKPHNALRHTHASVLIALGKPADSYEAIIGQHVKLLRDGQELKQSKRAGTMVEIRDLIDEGRR